MSPNLIVCQSFEVLWSVLFLEEKSVDINISFSGSMGSMWEEIIGW